MSDYFAGQQFFDFYPSSLDSEVPVEEPVVIESARRH
jgi:hypothetical protein